MDLQLTPEQEQLIDTMRQMLNAIRDETNLIPLANETTLWNSLGDFGALDVGSADDQLGAVEAALIARELGQVLAPGPFGDSAAVRYALGDRLDEAATTRFATALNEGRSSLDSLSRTTWSSSLSGEKRSVLCGGRSDRLVVSANGPSGAAVLLVAPDVIGVTLMNEESLDVTLEPVRVTFDGVVQGVSVLADSDATDRLERLDAIGAVLAAAHAVGAGASVLELARDYAASRKQFGRSIGSFQAIRHILAEMYTKIESSWSSVLYAASSLDEGVEDALTVASIAKAYAGRATLQVAHDALQVFGGVAFTLEHPAHRHLRRIVVLADHFGSPRELETVIGRALVMDHVGG